MVQSGGGGLYDGIPAVIGEADGFFIGRMQEHVCGTAGPLLNNYVLILLNMGVLLFGVRKGIERLSNVLMPILFVLLLVFCCVSLSLPGASDGLRYFLSPDFSKITPSVVVNALGQVFFSLSLGMGILITNAAYYPKETRLCRTAVTVSLLYMMAAVLMGMIIFPAERRPLVCRNPAGYLHNLREIQTENYGEGTAGAAQSVGNDSVSHRKEPPLEALHGIEFCYHVANINKFFSCVQP